MDFCPIVYSVDEIPGRDAKAAKKQLTTILSGKWNRPYSQMVHYMRVRMCVAVVRLNSLLIHEYRFTPWPCI